MPRRFTGTDEWEKIVLLADTHPISNSLHFSSRHSVICRRTTCFRFVVACSVFSIFFALTLSVCVLIIAPTQAEGPPVFGEINVQDNKSYVIGPPTERFRDNLRSDVQYITSWLSAGWTNDVMTIGNLVYLAMMTERIPIIPRFVPTHIGIHEPFIPFREVFDIPRLSKALRIPILEWDQVKNVNSNTVDNLGCWAVWPAIAAKDTPPRHSRNLEAMHLNVSYTVAPPWVQLSPPSATHGSLWEIARLSFPGGREEALKESAVHSPQHQESLPPDDHLLCYDLLYYVAANRPFEWERDFSPVWRFVGRHMHWNSTLEKLAAELVRRAINVADDEPTPPYIGVHVRRGDFHKLCRGRPMDECFAPLPVIARRVAEVQQELLDKKGIDVRNVIMASDEQDPDWWAEVRSLGWTWIDYAAEKTAEKHGKWYPVFLDAVLLSGGAGFVGTAQSTFSYVALRRVQDWNDGAVRMIKFGRPGVDDH